MVQPTSKAKPLRTLSSEVVWSSPWYWVRQDRIRRPDGTDGVFNVVEHPGAVWVVPLTDDGKIVLLRHYRYTVDDWCWEVPAGGIKEHATLEETALEELKEEVGGAAKELHHIGHFYTSNGISNEVAHVFLAVGVHLGETSHEPAEIIEVHLRPAELVFNMARNFEISDGPSALALLLCEQHVRQLSRM